MKISKSRFYAFFALIAFVILSVGYYNYFTLQIDEVSLGGVALVDSVNIHDHGVYVDTIRNMGSGTFYTGFNNNYGISAIYYGIGELFGLEAPHWPLVALLVNLFFLVCSFVLYAKIHDLLNVNPYSILFFFLNTPLLYFAQLINKDMLTIFSILLIIYFLLKQNYWALILLPILLIFVRVQLAVYCILLLFVVLGSRPRLRLFLVYTLCALVAGFVSVYFPVISETTLTSGVSREIYSLSREYVFIYFFVDPIRLLIAYKSLLDSFLFIHDGQLDVSRAINIPFVLGFLFLTKDWLTALLSRRYYFDYRSRVLISAIFVYFFVWLINPTINVRYILLIVPVFFVLAMYRRAQRSEYFHRLRNER